jgi:ankyrin repeat protein
MLNEGFDMSKTLFRVPEMRFRSTPLKFVVKNNNLSLVQFLLEKGVNPNIGEWTPLIISIIMGFHQISEKLITLGTNTCKPDKNGKTPLYWAVNKKNINIINLLLDHGAALLHAIDSDYLDIVQLLVKRGAPLNVVSPETPLTKAIMRGHLNIARFLIESGADVNLADSFGNHPVEVYVEKFNFEMIQEHPYTYTGSPRTAGPK